jgi:hypothetical protein
MITLAAIYFVALDVPEKEIPVTEWLLSLNGVDMKQVCLDFMQRLLFGYLLLDFGNCSRICKCL